MIQGKYLPTARQFYTGNASLERDLFIKYGGFNPSFRRAEDVEFAYRIANNGVTFMFNPDAVVYHYAKRSLKSWMETAYIYGKNNVIFANNPGNEWLLPITYAEFNKRNLLTQILVKLFIGRPRLKKYCVKSLLQIGGFSYKTGLRPLSYMAFSSIFNLQYYQGLAEELGGRQYFMRAIHEVS
jgi:GT2 family glycosyltransferase